MAFNPFDIVRKRSKAIFAVLGIVVMLTFVLSAGAGMGQGLDFFDQIGGLFASRGNNEVMAEAYGKKITVQDLQSIRLQRTMANEFMLEAVAVSNVRSADELAKEMADDKNTKINKTVREAVLPLAKAKAESRKGDREARAYATMVSLTFSRQNISQELIRWFTAERSATTPEERAAMGRIQQIVQFDMSRSQQKVFFSTFGFERDRDLLEFAMLLKKADQLDLNYSTNAVDQLVESELDNRFSVKTDWNAVENRLRDRNKELTTSWLKNALANEFRVRSVLTTMIGGSPVRSQFMGSGATLSDLPGAVTPYEFFEFYKDKCSESNFSLLELSAEAFLAEVTGSPTPKEREELFAKHKGDEPNPALERPGFKDPKKVKLEYITLDAKDKRIVENLAKLKAAETILGSFAAASSIGGNAVTALTRAAYPLRADESAIKQRVGFRIEEAMQPYNSGDIHNFQPRTTSIFQPLPIISAMGALAGIPTNGSGAAAVTLAFRQVELAEHKTRVPMALQAALTPTNPSMGSWVGAAALVLAHTPKPPAEGLFLKEVQEEYRKQQIRDTFEWDIKAFQDKLKAALAKATPADFGKPEKAKQDQAKAEARKLVDEWVKERGLKITGNKEARDKWALTTDPDLKVLNDLTISEPEGTNGLSKKYFDQFATAYNPEWFPSDPSGEGLDKPNHLVWLTDEIAPQAYLNLKNADNLTNGEMTKRVDAAWRLQKARDLAKAKADELSKKVKDIAKTVGTDPLGVDKQLRDLAFEAKLRKVDLERLALLKFDHGATSPRDANYKEPTIAKTSVTYPTFNFAEQLLDLRNKPLGEVVVLHDAPRTKYYIACMTQRREKTIDEFRSIYLRSSSVTEDMGRDPLYRTFALREERQKAVSEALARIKAEANYKETDAFKKYDKNSTDGQ